MSVPCRPPGESTHCCSGSRSHGWMGGLVQTSKAKEGAMATWRAAQAQRGGRWRCVCASILLAAAAACCALFLGALFRCFLW
uniref:Uncharacterized protein n=1 Tax=Setaria italica TaxID=4555 RepID=K4AN79_SETIT